MRFVGVGPGDVEPEVIEGGFSEEALCAGEAFDLVELVLDEAVGGFDVCLPGMGCCWNGGVSQSGHAADGFGEATLAFGVPGAYELDAVVGLYSGVFQVHPAGKQVGQEDLCEEGSIAEGSFVGKGNELHAADDLSGGVLDCGESQASYLGPELWDIIEVFGVHTGLLKQPPLGFDSTKVLFGFVLASWLLEKPLLAPYAADGFLADGEFIDSPYALCAEGGQALLEAYGFSTLCLTDGVGGVLRSFALVLKAPHGAGLPSPQPFAHRLGSGAKQPGGRLDPLCFGIAHQLVSVELGVFHLTYHRVVSNRGQDHLLLWAGQDTKKVTPPQGVFEGCRPRLATLASPYSPTVTTTLSVLLHPPGS